MAIPVVEFSREGCKIRKVFGLKSTAVKWNWHYSNSQNSIISFDHSWFLAKNISNFVSFPWKLHNRYCHNQRQQQRLRAPHHGHRRELPVEDRRWNGRDRGRDLFRLPAWPRNSVTVDLLRWINRQPPDAQRRTTGGCTRLHTSWHFNRYGSELFQSRHPQRYISIAGFYKVVPSAISEGLGVTLHGLINFEWRMGCLLFCT